MQYPLIESYSRCLGVDTQPDIPTRQARSILLAHSVNRGMYKSLNDTRPPFIEMGMSFASTEDEYTFKNAAISGMKFYKGEGSLFSSFLIVTVGNLVLAGFIKPGFVDFIRIYKGLDPQWTHQYFCQALNILTINDSVNPGIYWTGDISKPMKNIFKSTYTKGAPMKISSYATYANGRIFYNAENLIYASDYIQSQGLALADREAVLANSESEYPSSGDGFGAPSEMGNITGILTAPQSDTLNGHGDVLALCSNGVFSIATNRKVRNEWTNDPEMQKHVLIGKGCISNDSIASFANQVFYRDNNSQISSLFLDIASYQNKGDLIAISDPVNDYTDYDFNTSNIQFANSFVTRRRMLSTVCHYRENSIHMGVHRYAMGMVSAVLQKRDNKSGMAWEGLWTGPRIVAGVTSDVGGSKTAIVASFDTDKQNRLYYIDENAISGDYVQGQYRDIEWKHSYRGVFFDDGDNTPIKNRILQKIEALMIESNPKEITATFNVDYLQEQHEIGLQLTGFTGCALSPGRLLSEDICSVNSITTNRMSKEGHMFNINFYGIGKAKFAKVTIGGSEQSQAGFENNRCSEVINKGITSICFFPDNCNKKVNNFNYQF